MKLWQAHYNMVGGTATAGTAMAVPPFRVFFVLFCDVCTCMCVYAITMTSAST